MMAIGDCPETLSQETREPRVSAASALTMLPQTSTCTWTGICTVLPDSTSGVASAISSVGESACASLLYSDRAPVTAAAMTIPLLRVCRTLVSSYSKKGILASDPKNERLVAAFEQLLDGRCGGLMAVGRQAPSPAGRLHRPRHHTGLPPCRRGKTVRFLCFTCFPFPMSLLPWTVTAEAERAQHESLAPWPADCKRGMDV